MIPARPIPTQALTDAHAQGLLNGQLADLFGVSLSTLKRWLRELGLQSNHHANRIGRLGEQLVAQAFTAQGYEVEAMFCGSSFDLRVAGQRMDVKATDTRSPQDTYTFRLPTSRPSFRNAYRYPKNYLHDTDFLALACLEDDLLAYLYVLPVALWQPRITIRPSSPFDPLAGYLNAFTLLRAHPAAV